MSPLTLKCWRYPSRSSIDFPNKLSHAHPGPYLTKTLAPFLITENKLKAKSLFLTWAELPSVVQHPLSMGYYIKCRIHILTESNFWERKITYPFGTKAIKIYIQYTSERFILLSSIRTGSLTSLFLLIIPFFIFHWNTGPLDPLLSLIVPLSPSVFFSLLYMWKE